MRDACARELIRRRLLSDVCSFCVSLNASVSLARRGMIDTEEVENRNARLSH